MAFIKQITLPTGETGDYWRIVEINDHAELGSVVTLQLYKSKALRGQNAQPLALSLQFVFDLNEIESVDPDENRPKGWRDVWYHCHYLAIKAASVSGHEKADEERTENERKAQVIYGSQDDY